VIEEERTFIYQYPLPTGAPAAAVEVPWFFATVWAYLLTRLVGVR